MSIEQITVEIFNRQFTIGAPDNERATLLKAVDLLNQKIQTIHGNRKNRDYGVVESDIRFTQNE